jgi:hypothetical protein
LGSALFNKRASVGGGRTAEKLRARAGGAGAQGFVDGTSAPRRSEHRYASADEQIAPMKRRAVGGKCSQTTRTVGSQLSYEDPLGALIDSGPDGAIEVSAFLA